MPYLTTRIVVLAATMLSSTAVAQVNTSSAAGTAPVLQDGTSDDGEKSTDIVVTGSRITQSGYTAPTPTTVIDAAAIAKNAEPNIFNTVAQLPALMGSTGRTTGVTTTSSGTQGLSSFSLRGLGTIRTLTLLDGQRFVGANVTGVPDISQFPHAPT